MNIYEVLLPLFLCNEQQGLSAAGFDIIPYFCDSGSEPPSLDALPTPLFFLTVQLIKLLSEPSRGFDDP